MKCGMRMAGAVGVGYVLGRTRKMKLALMLAGVGLSGRGGPQAVLERTTSAVSSSPEFTKIAETVRGELLDAARAAAVTAASNRIDSLNTRLQRHGDLGRELGDAAPDLDTEDEYEPPEDEPAEDGEPAEPAPDKSRTATRARPAATRRSGERRARTPARATASAASRRGDDAGGTATRAAPVRRTRR
ncbi:hypothetical protein [Nocardia sp. CA-290969]|uniref:hypothetical protein n=1 Tax=Nocardia sp. CA-290969 TaxID=3239986 RepID=UPI003D8ADEAF